MDFTLYWFMLPVAAVVATCAMLSGIGGAALFTPIFVVIFPLLGPQYALESSVAAIGTALLTQVFGFASGFVGYHRRRMIDYELAARILRVSAPVAVIGALSAGIVDDALVVGGYALLVGVLSVSFLFFDRAAGAFALSEEGEEEMAAMRSRTDNAGRTYIYRAFDLGPVMMCATAVGAFLTGLLSVGIGEVVVPQLTKRGVPMAVAAATSVAVVIVTVACASFALVGQLVASGGLSAVPWNLVCYTIPGVIIGGQIGPRLQGVVPQHSMNRVNGVLFLVISIATGFVFLKKIGA